MIKLLKNMRRREVLMAVLCAVLVLAQVYFDLTLPDYMTDLTMLLNTAGSETSDILNVGLKMLGCTLASAALAIGCGYLSSKTASGFSYAVREKLFNHVMDMGSEEMQDFSIPSLITRTTNDITQIQMIVSMGLQMIIKSPIMAVWAVIKILGKSWQLSAVTAAFVVVICVFVLAVMATCIPRFRIVQKLTDKINRVARENLTGINVVHAFNAEKYQNDKFDVGYEHRHEWSYTCYLLAWRSAYRADSTYGCSRQDNAFQQRCCFQHICHIRCNVIYDACYDIHDAPCSSGISRAYQRSA